MSIFGFIKNGRKQKLNLMPSSYPSSRVTYNNGNVSDALDDKVSKSGDTMSGTLAINGVQDALVADSQNGTNGAVGWTFVKVGNNKASNVDKNSAGILRLYGKTDKFVDFFDNAGFSANRNIYIPDKNGTLALTSDIPDVSVKVNKSGDRMSGDLTISKTNTSTTSTDSALVLGNDISDGNVGASHGALYLFGKANRYSVLVAENITAPNKVVQLPNASGTLALMSNITFGVLTVVNWRYNEVSFSVDSYSAIILYGARQNRGLFVIFAPNSGEYSVIKNDFGCTFTYTKTGESDYNVTISAATSTVGSVCNLYVLGRPV